MPFIVVTTCSQLVAALRAEVGKGTLVDLLSRLFWSTCLLRLAVSVPVFSFCVGAPPSVFFLPFFIFPRDRAGEWSLTHGSQWFPKKGNFTVRFF